MTFETIAAVSGGWPSLGDLALYGLITTLLAALGGIGAQLWISRRAARDAERLRRYDELIAVYNDIGVYMSASASALSRLIQFDASGNLNPITALRHGKKVMKAHEAWMIENTVGHRVRLLTLHRAGQEVKDAFNAWWEETQLVIPTIASDEEAKSWWDAKLKQSSDKAKEFYRVAGVDAAKALVGK